MATLGGYVYMMNSRATMIKGLDVNSIHEIKICLDNIWLNVVNWGNITDDSFLEKNLCDLPHLNMTTVELFKEGIITLKSAVDAHPLIGTDAEKFQIMGVKKTISHNFALILSILDKKFVE